MNYKRIAVVMAVVVVLAVSAALVLAQTEPQTYYACVNNSSGTIHMVESGDVCTNNEELYTWGRGVGASGYNWYWNRFKSVTIPQGEKVVDSISCEGVSGAEGWDFIDGGYAYSTTGGELKIYNAYPWVTQEYIPPGTGNSLEYRVIAENIGDIDVILQLNAVCAKYIP